jgi:hypothetical protein
VDFVREQFGEKVGAEGFYANDDYDYAPGCEEQPSGVEKV